MSAPAHRIVAFAVNKLHILYKITVDFTSLKLYVVKVAV
jgi:hypothetical protein